MRIKINNEQWRVVEIERDETLMRGDTGYCNIKGKRIEIREHLRPRMRLNTLVHEAIHAYMPHLNHKRVYELGDLIEQLLWKDGYRRIK